MPPPEAFLGPAIPTNPPSFKPGVIAELCVPEEPEVARRLLAQLVKDLNQQPLFAKVDLLSDDLHRSLADPKVVIPDRHFFLALDFAATGLQQPLPIKRPAPVGARPAAKRPARSAANALDLEEKTLAP